VRGETFWVIERLGQWIVRHDDVEIASLPSRTHAVAVAVRRAKEAAPSEVLVLGRNGGIEEHRVFGEDDGEQGIASPSPTDGR
jgi:uncharacterized protein DUF2188